MKKLWFGLFAFVLSVCCGLAIVHGSYTKSNLIAHSNAYVGASTYQVPDGAVDLNWVLVSDMYIPTYNNNTRPVYSDGYWYQFYAQNLVDGSTFDITITDASNGTQTINTYTIASDPEEELSFNLKSAESYVYDGYVYACSGNKVIKFALNTSNLSFNYPFYYDFDDEFTLSRLNYGFAISNNVGDLVVFSNGTFNVIDFSNVPLNVSVSNDSFEYDFSVSSDNFVSGGFLIGDKF